MGRKEYLDRSAEQIAEKWLKRLGNDATLSDVLRYLDVENEREWQAREASRRQRYRTPDRESSPTLHIG